MSTKQPTFGSVSADACVTAAAGEYGYAVVLGADCAEGEPSARSQLVENAAAAVAAAGVAVAVHKLDITALEDGAAFVVAGEDGSQVRLHLKPLCCDEVTTVLL